MTVPTFQDESTRLSLEQTGLKEKVKENKEKIKLSNQLPYLVGNVVEVLDVVPDDDEVSFASSLSELSFLPIELVTCNENPAIKAHFQVFRIVICRRTELQLIWTLRGRASA